jgi:S1-C subfamily serine protease
VAQNSAGTGFLHKSKKIITAAHVVTGCTDPIIVTSNNQIIKGKVDDIDPNVDLALIETAVEINAPALALSPVSESDIKIGRQVSTWGFPGGYSGLPPMLSVGYLSGVQANTTPGGQVRRQWVVNAAFNRGNSGGPLLLTETGEVIGVVDSKLAPFGPWATVVPQTLERSNSDTFKFTAELSDGSTQTYSYSRLLQWCWTSCGTRFNLLSVTQS